MSPEKNIMTKSGVYRDGEGGCVWQVWVFEHFTATSVRYILTCYLRNKVAEHDDWILWMCDYIPHLSRNRNTLMNPVWFLLNFVKNSYFNLLIYSLTLRCRKFAFDLSYFLFFKSLITLCFSDLSRCCRVYIVIL